MTSKEIFETIINQEKIAHEFGFYWENTEQLFNQIMSECQEIEEAIKLADKNHLKEEIGDLINATISLSIFLGLNPLEALNSSVEKFQKRYNSMLELAKIDGLIDFKELSLKEKLTYWEKAKNLTAHELLAR